MSYLVGLTGGIASGKSTVSEMFRAQRIPVIDGDEIAHQLMLPKKKNWLAIVDNFGPEILNSDQTINRKKLGQIVFNDSEKLNLLNQIVQPNIKEAILQKMIDLKDQKIVVLDLPLLIEQGYVEMVDLLVVVFVSPEIQLTRLMMRNNLNEADAIKKIESQMPLTDKLKQADVVIDNSDTIEKTTKQFEQLLAKLKNN